jgi:basic membrane protein A
MSSRRLRRATAAIAGLAALVGAACGGGASGGAGAPAQGLTVAMVLPGPINDKSFNQTSYEGLQVCRSMGIGVSYAEDVQTPDFLKTFQRYARVSKVVMAPGDEFGTVADQVAPQFPNVKFVVTSNPQKPAAPNVEHTMINATQGAFLAGVVAGQITKTNKLGGVAGIQLPVLQAEMAAFEAGAKWANPKISFNVVYLGTFDDVAKGKEAAQSLAASGVDVVYHIADAAGVGVINGAQAAGIKAIGWGTDQHSIAPGTVVASQLSDGKKEVADICRSLSKGEFAGGGVKVEGLRTGLTSLSRIYDQPATVQQKVDQARQGILDGAIQVPPIGPGIPASGPASG